MPDLLASLVRDAAQKVVGVVAVWLAAHAAPLPHGVQSALESWLVLGGSAAGLWLWTAVTRWLETANGAGQLAIYRRALGRILMLGLAHKPTYPTPAPAAPPAPVAPPAPPVTPAA